jgi:deoxyadenosine/deoxycytidine kinase
MLKKEQTDAAETKPEIRYIAIEGVIGAGKTSLALLLGEKLKAKLILEKFEENPFLSKFYTDPERYSLHTQIFFLLSRYRQLQELYQADLFHQYLISDYIFEKDRIFAYLNLADDELKLYETITASIEHNVPVPDLVVYIQCSVERLMENIRKRGREVESRITEQYIHDLNEAYNYFFFRYKGAPLLIVNATQMDFVNDEAQFEELVGEIFRKDRAPVEYYNPIK